MIKGRLIYLMQTHPSKNQEKNKVLQQVGSESTFVIEALAILIWRHLIPCVQ
ncbi:MAG: hypothetical protein ACJAZT_001688 [Gammaproteobacteria bacterium]|jgi:hypothetical protein